MKKYFSNIFPSLAASISFFIVPFILSVYFIITNYSDKFIATGNIDYFSVQSNVLATFFLSQSYVDWLNRFMDFALWGVFAAIVLLIVWAISVGRISVHNHLAQQEFVNFRASKQSWHGQFAVVAAVKVLLVFVMLYTVFQLIAHAIPLLATGIASCVQVVNGSNILGVAKAVLLIFVLQFLLVSCIKLFKLTRAD